MKRLLIIALLFTAVGCNKELEQIPPTTILTIDGIDIPMGVPTIEYCGCYVHGIGSVSGEYLFTAMSEDNKHKIQILLSDTIQTQYTFDQGAWVGTGHGDKLVIQTPGTWIDVNGVSQTSNSNNYVVDSLGLINLSMNKVFGKWNGSCSGTVSAIGIEQHEFSLQFNNVPPE